MCRRIKIAARQRAQQYPDLGNPLVSGNSKKLNKELVDQKAVQQMINRQRESSLNQDIVS